MEEVLYDFKESDYNEGVGLNDGISKVITT